MESLWQAKSFVGYAFRVPIIFHPVGETLKMRPRFRVIVGDRRNVFARKCCIDLATAFTLALSMKDGL